MDHSVEDIIAHQSKLLNDQAAQIQRLRQALLGVCPAAIVDLIQFERAKS